MTASSARFLDAVELTPVSPTMFLARTQYVPWPKAYGGDLLAQAAAAATRTVAADRTLHAMHSTFLAGAGIESELRYEVEVLRDGRSYSTRQVRAYEGDRLLFTALLSFHVGEHGDDIARALPDGLADPERLPSSAEALAGRDDAAARYWATGRSFDVRHDPSPIYAGPVRDRRMSQAIWVRPFEPLPADPALHLLALIYVCDYTMLEPVLRSHGRAWGDPGLVTASLDHAMWLHRPVSFDDWIVFVQQAESAQRGRALGSGAFFTRSGELLATVLQEGVIRLPASA